MLKAEIPHFLALSTSLITPIFQTFYYIEVGILCASLASSRALSPSPTLTPTLSPRAADTLLEKMQAFTGQTYGDLSVDNLESMHYERSGDAPEQIENLSITKRFTSTGASSRFAPRRLRLPSLRTRTSC